MPERGQPDASWMGISEKFPCSLDKDTAPEFLKDGQSPDSFGLGLEKHGWLYYDSSPSVGTTWDLKTLSSNPTNTPLTGTQYWGFWFNRLWGWQTTTNSLTYGAFGYDSNFIIDGLGYVPVDVETSSITNVVPFGNAIAVFKGTRLYIIRNADNPSAGFVAEYLGQTSGVASGSGNKIAIDGMLYWITATGVFACDGQKVVEITYPVRNNLGPFVTATSDLYADFFKKRIIGGTGTATKFIIDVKEQTALFDYSTSGFRFTTRTLVAEGGEPLLVDKVAVIYQYSAGDVATIDFDVKINDTWKSESQFKIRPADANGRAEFALSSALSCRKFALRITDMSESLYISKILIHVKSGGTLGYSNK